METINYSLLAESMDGHVSAPPVSCSLDINIGHYALFSYDRSGQISGRVNVRIAYVVNHYVIFSEDSSDNISDSDYARCIVKPIPFPTNVRIPAQFITATTFKVEWNPVAGINLYRVYIRNLSTDDFYFFDADTPEYIAINLRPDTTYEVYVASHIGNNVFSAHTSTVIAKTVTYTINIHVIPTKTTLRLFWQDVAGAALYTIYHGIPGASGTTEIAQETVAGIDGHLVENLQSARQYTFSIIAANANGDSIASGMVTTKTLANIPLAPNRLGFVVENVTPYSFDIRWEPIMDAEFYALYLNYSEHPYTPFIYDVRTHVGNLRPDTIYAVSIAAINNAGNTESQPVVVRTLVAVFAETPRPPRLIFPNPDHTTADPTPTLYWEVPRGREGDRYEFLVEIAEDKDFTKNVRKINSSVNKQGFSYQSPREANSDETISLRIQDALVIY